jgi:(p)ppGpp synthase/HD superfamily hydrolase
LPNSEVVPVKWSKKSSPTDTYLQIDLEEETRQKVSADLRAYLNDNRYPEWILPNSEVVPVKWSKKSSPTDTYLQIDLEEETRQKVSADLHTYLNDNRYPEWILPNSEVVPVKWSKKSSPTDTYVQLDTELDLES